MIFAGLYLVWHFSEVWLQKLKALIIFTTFNHSLLNGDGNGRGCWATLILSKLHILSYANVTSGTLEVVFTKEHNHCTSMKNTCDGDSDLQQKVKLQIFNHNLSFEKIVYT